MVVVESAENAEIVRAAGAGAIAADDSSAAAAELRLERLKWLPTSLPVGGIITPV